VTTTTPAEGTRRAAGPVRLRAAAHAVLRPLPLGAVRITSGLWAGRQLLNRSTMLPGGWAQLQASRCVDNFRLVGERRGGAHHGPRFADSDAYKWLEAVGWDHARPGAAPDPHVDRLIGLVAAAQDPDGYLDTYVQLGGAPGRFADLAHGHELYCAGHLIQGAIAHARARGDERLLEVACHFADLIVRYFGPGGDLEGRVPGHPEIETALVELYRETGHDRYLDIAVGLLAARGRGTLGGALFGGAYFQDVTPLRRTGELAGHAVRAVYLAAGGCDAYLETGDDELLAALRQQWDDLVATKSYLTGGIGSRHADEALGDAYELPADRAYAETCAAIGAAMWGWWLLLATGDCRYADHIERLLHNAVAAGFALDGSSYSYVNPLHVRCDHPDDPDEVDPPFRRPWFGCACCPPNVMRLLASLEHYLATGTGAGIQVHQYASMELRAELADGPLALRVDTDYPWDGRIGLSVEAAPPGEAGVSLRVPGWCSHASLILNGSPVAVAAVPGAYATLQRRWSPGDTVELCLDMSGRFTRAHPRVDAVRGCVAVERGPIVYCIEGRDLPPGTALDEVLVEPTAGVRPGGPDDELGVQTLTVTAGALAGEELLYAPLAEGDRAVSPGWDQGCVPYFAWGNRGAGPMRVWLPWTRPTAERSVG